MLRRWEDLSGKLKKKAASKPAFCKYRLIVYRERVVMSILFKQDNGFNMVGLGKHIDGMNVPDPEPLPCKLRQITAEGGRIAGDIDHPAPGQGRQFPGQSRHALPGGIQDDTVEDAALADEVPAGLMDGGFFEDGVSKACRQAVFPGAADGRSLAFKTG